ncbi:adenylosuccinate synthase [candidate division WOR-3 bacterium]|nr:adenylosuccinate synthase [candidate division WOR-3 bacterium]
MNSLALIGLQWGDEGKGKLVDWLSARFDLDIRYQGGPNAGHTVVVNGKKWVFHQMPAGILNPGINVAIAAGCILHPETLFKEWEELDADGVEYLSRTFIDPRVNIILPQHRLLDRLRDEARGKNKIGTTGRGIGPCYEDKHAYYGLRIGDLFSASLDQRLEIIVDHHNAIIEKVYGADGVEKKTVLEGLEVAAERIRPLVADVSNLAYEYIESGKKVLFEGAQGVLLDIDHGSYPFVTSSNPGAIFVPTGVGISPKLVARVLGLTKAYATRVGAGPFPTEASGELEARLQKLGQEFGAATGRRRRCGWLDLPLLRYAVRLNGVDGLAITKLDVLDSFDRLKVCTGYRQPDGTVKGEITPRDFDPGEPVYEEIEGWKKTTSEADNFEDLPSQAQDYIRWISTQVDIPVWMVSVGQDRTKTIALPDLPF